MVLDKIKDALAPSPSRYRCEECDIDFESRHDIGIARCPDCGGSQLIPAPE